MKRLFIISALTVISIHIFAQDIEIDYSKFNRDHTSPIFVGKNTAEDKEFSLNDYITALALNSEYVENQFLIGKEVIRFSVKADGTVDNFRVIQSVCKEGDLAVIESIKKTNGMWIAGAVMGVTIPLDVEVEVIFNQENFELVEEASKHYFKGLVKLRKHKNRKALKEFNKALEILPDHTYVNYFKGCANYKLGNYNDAMISFNRVKELQSNLADPYINALSALNKE